jgi:hypothetical protein
MNGGRCLSDGSESEGENELKVESKGPRQKSSQRQSSFPG